MKAKNLPSKGKVSYASMVKVKHSEISNKEPSRNVTRAVISSSNTSKSSKAVSPEIWTTKYNFPKVETKKSMPNNSVGNKTKPSEKVKNQQNVGKKPQQWLGGLELSPLGKETLGPDSKAE